LSRRICYVRESTVSRYHSAHAKNIAAKAATGEILVNLDADTFTGPGLASRLSQIFTDDRKRVIQVGRTGTVALLRRDFYHLRGYDERMRGWGYDDVDLIARACMSGLTKLRHRGGRYAARINHSDEDRERLMGISMAESRRTNRRLARANRQSGLIQPNGESWGAAELEIVSRVIALEPANGANGLDH
jgi:hypothetical protein